MSDTLTRGVRIIAQPQYEAEQSDPDDERFLFSYQITIRNESPEPVQLMSRRWIITNGRGEINEVNGPGVVGEQPRLEPGQSFSYTSACPLETPIGTMHGSFQMVTDGGEAFDARILPFRLAQPGILQ